MTAAPLFMRTPLVTRPFRQAQNVYHIIVKQIIALVLIPVNVVTDSDLIPGSDSDAMPVTIGAKRRW